MMKFIICCPYCKKAIGIELEVTSVNIKEKKVNQNTYEELKEQGRN